MSPQSRKMWLMLKLLNKITHIYTLKEKILDVFIWVTNNFNVEIIQSGYKHTWIFKQSDIYYVFKKEMKLECITIIKYMIYNKR